MSLSSFKILPKSSVGIDIGTSAIKVVELSRWGQRVTLKNYGEMRAAALYKKPFRTFEKNTLLLSSADIARALKAIFAEAGMMVQKAIFSIPDFSTFFTQFELPPMTREELPNAVRFEAHKHIPVSLSQVVYDWQIVEGKFERKEPFQILIVAVPNEVINQYQEIAKLAQIELGGLEAEVFGLIRSCVRDEKKALIVMDIGAQSTIISIIEKGNLKISHSIDTAGNSLTARIAQSFSLPYEKAEERKQKEGIHITSNGVPILQPLIDSIIAEIQEIAKNYLRGGGKEIEKVILGGGSALLPGLREYVEQNFGKPTEIGDPFREIFYPPILEQVTREIGPAYAVAVGMALKGLE